MVDKLAEFDHSSLTIERSAPDGSLPLIDPACDALLLDIDGTIIDIAPTPEAVTVPETLKLSLFRVREKLRGALALISGRTLASVDGLFAPLTFSAIGCHGAELRPSPERRIQQR